MNIINDFYVFYKRILQLLSIIILASVIVIIGHIIYLGVLSNNEYSLSYDWSIDSKENEEIYVLMNKTDTWVAKNGLTTAYEGVIVNKTKYTLYDWKIEVKVPQRCSISTYWNSQWKINNGVATIDPSDITRNVGGKSIQKFGVIFFTKEEPELNEITITYKKTLSVTELAVFAPAVVIIFVCTIAGSILAFSYIQVKNYKETHASYKDLVQESLRTIANIIDTKDEYTRGHSIRVAIYARMLAERMGLSEHDQERIYYIGMLHDIGKIGIPVAILTKPGRLSDEEFEIIKRHPRLGASIMKDFSSIDGVVDGVRYHHERYDGRGYNEGLKGEDIPLIGRIICVADSYDAMSSVRCYRKTLGYDFILQELKDNAGKQFDPEIVKHMIDLVEEGYAPVSEAEMEYSKNEKKKKIKL